MELLPGVQHRLGDGFRVGIHVLVKELVVLFILNEAHLQQDGGHVCGAEHRIVAVVVLGSLLDAPVPLDANLVQTCHDAVRQGGGLLCGVVGLPDLVSVGHAASGVAVDRDVIVGMGFVGDLTPVHQFDEGVVLTGHHNCNALGFHFLPHTQSQLQHIVFFQPLLGVAAGILAAVSRVNAHDDPFSGQGLRLRLCYHHGSRGFCRLRRDFRCGGRGRIAMEEIQRQQAEPAACRNRSHQQHHDQQQDGHRTFAPCGGFYRTFSVV